MTKSYFILLLLCVLCLTCARERAAQAIDHVTFIRDGKPQTVHGETITTAQDGGRLIKTPDGTIWSLPSEEIQKVTSDETAFELLDETAIAKQLLKDLPSGFRIHTTAHYVICYNTSRSYAIWCGSLLERLNKAFTNYWSRRGFKLNRIKSPLPVIIFSNKTAYKQFAKSELGDAADSILGYYSLRTNRVLMYDLTGVQTIRKRNDRQGSLKEINAMLSRPEAEPLVATIIHEATHQISFNCGLQTRFADNPLWLSEGLAIYFETPDLASGKGWRGIGKVHRSRLKLFRSNVSNRPNDALASLIANDATFRDKQTGLSAYAEAWALNYFLIRKHSKEYNAYLKSMSQKPRMVWDTPAERLDEFRKAFGGNLKELDQEFLEYMRNVR